MTTSASTIRSITTGSDPGSSSPSETMTLEEFAGRMGISITVAYELAAQDKLPVPAIRVGRRYLFSRRAYDALLDRQHGDAPDGKGGSSTAASGISSRNRRASR